MVHGSDGGELVEEDETGSPQNDGAHVFIINSIIHYNITIQLILRLLIHFC